VMKEEEHETPVDDMPTGDDDNGVQLPENKEDSQLTDAGETTPEN